MAGKIKCPQCCRVCANPALIECPSCAAPLRAPKTCRQNRHVLPLPLPRPPMPKMKQSLPQKAWKSEQPFRQDEFPALPMPLPVPKMKQSLPQKVGKSEQSRQSDDAVRQEEASAPEWFKNWDNGEWEQWIKNSKTGKWEQVQQADEHERSDVAVGEDAQESWDEERDDADSDGREVVAKDVYEDDAESVALEVSASELPAPVDDDQRFQSFLSSLGSDFDVAFIRKHAGASSYEDLIMYTLSKEDLNPLVDAGMKPLQRNKLFRAIEREREHPAH